VDEDKSIQAYRKGDKHLVLFDDVNVGLMVERKVGEKRALMGHTIQAATARPTGRFTTRFARCNRTRSAWKRDALLVPFCHAVAVAIVQAGNRFAALKQPP